MHIINSNYERYRTIFLHVPKPFAFVDLDLLDQNIASVLKASGDKSIRIATKSIRSVEVLRRILSSHPRFQGLMCYTVDEANFLLHKGFENILIGYPSWDEQCMHTLFNQHQERAASEVIFMIDSIEHVEHMEKLAHKLDTTIRLCIDIDMSVTYPGLHFGVRRSPLKSWTQVLPVVNRILNNSQLQLVGVMGYEAQIAGVGDSIQGKPLKNFIIQALKKLSIHEVARRRNEIIEGLAKLNHSLHFVNAGGTGSLSSSKLEDGVSEVTVGSAFFAPTLFDHYKQFQYLPAAGFAIEVVRRPTSNIVTCLGGGYIASGAIGKEKQPLPYLPHGMRLTSLEGAGEVQTPLICSKGVSLQPGDPVFFRHAKAGELCERFTKLYVISDNKIVDCYDTYRGEGECFL